MSSTLATLRTRVRQRADMVDSDFISDSELLTYINESYAELYDLLVATYEDYYTEETSLSLSDGSGTIPLPADFYKLRALDKDLGGQWVTVYKFDFNARNAQPTGIREPYLRDTYYRIVRQDLKLAPEATADGSYRLWYIPEFTALSAESDTVDVPAGFDEYIVIDAAIKCLVKEESSTTALDNAKAAMMKRIENMAANRDAGQPEAIADINEFTYLW